MPRQIPPSVKKRVRQHLRDGLALVDISDRCALGLNAVRRIRDDMNAKSAGSPEKRPPVRKGSDYEIAAQNLEDSLREAAEWLDNPRREEKFLRGDGYDSGSDASLEGGVGQVWGVTHSSSENY